MSASEAAAAALIEDVQAEAAAEQPVEEPEAEAEAVEEAAPVGSYDPELPADISALLDDEPEEEPDPTVDDSGFTAEFDEDVEKLRKENAKLRKRQEFLEKQTAIQAKQGVKAEIEQYFPLADATLIAEAASSRREALRMAKEQHTQAKRGADAVAAHYEQNIEKLVAERIAEKEKQLHAQWGKPIGGPGEVPIAAGERAQVQEEIQSARTLHERVLAKIRTGQLAREITSMAEGGED